MLLSDLLFFPGTHVTFGKVTAHVPGKGSVVLGVREGDVEVVLTAEGEAFVEDVVAQEPNDSANAAPRSRRQRATAANETISSLLD
jgi:hypothetical protein